MNQIDLSENGVQRPKFPDFEKTPSYRSRSKAEKFGTANNYPAYHPIWYQWKRAVPKSFREAIQSTFRLDSKTDFYLLITLLMAVRRGEPDQAIIMSRETVATCTGMESDIHRNRQRKENSSGRILQSFIERVLPGATLKPYRPKKRAREIHGAEQALGAFILDLRDESFSISPLIPVEKVTLDWKSVPITEKNRSLQRTEDRKRYNQLATSLQMNELQGRLLEYLNNLSSYSFNIKEACLRETWAEIVAREDGNRKRILCQHVHAIYDNPCPIYLPSRKGGTVRIFTQGPSLASIEGVLRNTLKPEWIELDLSSAHLAIVAHDWGLTEIYSFLEAQQNIWDELYDHMRWKDYGIPSEYAKPAIKKGLYAATFGAGKRKSWVEIVLEYMSLDGRPTDILLSMEMLKSFLTHPFVKQLMLERNKQLELIRKQGGATDAFGNFIPCKEDKPTSVLASLAQSRELKLLQPVIDLAIAESRKDNPRFHIMLWQHDGFSIKVRNKRDEVNYVKRLVQSVEETKGAYPTRLVVKYPPTIKDVIESTGSAI